MSITSYLIGTLDRDFPSSNRVPLASQLKLDHYNHLHKPFNLPPLMFQSTSQTPALISPMLHKLLSIATHPSRHISDSSRSFEYGLAAKSNATAHSARDSVSERSAIMQDPYSSRPIQVGQQAPVQNALEPALGLQGPKVYLNNVYDSMAINAPAQRHQHVRTEYPRLSIDVPPCEYQHVSHGTTTPFWAAQHQGIPPPSELYDMYAASESNTMLSHTGYYTHDTLDLDHRGPVSISEFRNITLSNTNMVLPKIFYSTLSVMPEIHTAMRTTEEMALKGTFMSMDDHVDLTPPYETPYHETRAGDSPHILMGPHGYSREPPRYAQSRHPAEKTADSKVVDIAEGANMKDLSRYIAKSSHLKLIIACQGCREKKRK
jgi:hypothetical protein